MSFQKNNASLALRKAVHLAGIRGNWHWSPVNDTVNPAPHNYIAEISHGPHAYMVTSGEVTYADAFTWDEIKARS